MTGTTDTKTKSRSLPATPYLILKARVLVEDANGDLVDGTLPEGQDGILNISFDDFENLTSQCANYAASGTDVHVFDEHVPALIQSAHAPDWMRSFDGTLALELKGAEYGPSSVEDAPDYTKIPVTFILTPIRREEDGSATHLPIPEGQGDRITMTVGEIQEEAQEFDSYDVLKTVIAIPDFYLSTLLTQNGAPAWALDHYARIPFHSSVRSLYHSDFFEVRIDPSDLQKLEACAQIL